MRPGGDVTGRKDMRRSTMQEGRAGGRWDLRVSVGRWGAKRSRGGVERDLPRGITMKGHEPGGGKIRARGCAPFGGASARPNGEGVGPGRANSPPGVGSVGFGAKGRRGGADRDLP